MPFSRTIKALDFAARFLEKESQEDNDILLRIVAAEIRAVVLVLNKAEALEPRPVRRSSTNIPAVPVSGPIPIAVLESEIEITRPLTKIEPTPAPTEDKPTGPW